MTELVARVNPEFLRGWRAEVTRVRLAVTLALSIGVAWCIQLGWDWATLGNAAAVAFGVFSFVVTPIRIVGAIAEEHSRHTWQRQRMSALSPAQLMLGKAFGATGLTDLAALCALVCWGLGACLPAHLPMEAPAGETPEATLFCAGFFLDAWLMVCANLFARFLALALAIRNCDRSRAARGRSFVAAILLTGLISYPLAFLLMFLREPQYLPQRYIDTALEWFGIWPIQSTSFWAVSGLFFVALAVFWCWCAARETLSAARFAAEGLVVGLGVGLWWSGAAYADGGGLEILLIGPLLYGLWQTVTTTLLLVLVATAYLWGVAERMDRRKAREFLAAPDLRAASPWMLILLLAAVTAMAHLILGVFSNHGERGFFQQNFWVVSLLGFVVRDMGILLLVLSGRVKRWPELAALASWLVLGLFLPGALSGAGATARGFELFLLFSPFHFYIEGAAHLFIGVVSAWLQAGLIVAWLVWRARQARGNSPESLTARAT